MLDTKTPLHLSFDLGANQIPGARLIGPAHSPTELSVIASTIRKATIAFSTLPPNESPVLSRRLRDFDQTFH
jgi:hypothetical protein